MSTSPGTPSSPAPEAPPHPAGRRPTRLRNTGAAIALAVLLAGTWAVPAAISAATPDHTEPTGPDTTRSLTAPSGSTIEYLAPVGWDKQRTREHTAATYTGPGDHQSLVLSVVDGANDFDTTADRRLANLERSGTSAIFDGEISPTPNGFAGKSCVAVDTAERTAGRCAVVHHGDVVVTISATGRDPDATVDPMTLVDSLRIHEKEDGE